MRLGYRFADDSLLGILSDDHSSLGTYDLRFLVSPQHMCTDNLVRATGLRRRVVSVIRHIN